MGDRRAYLPCPVRQSGDRPFPGHEVRVENKKTAVLTRVSSRRFDAGVVAFVCSGRDDDDVFVPTYAVKRVVGGVVVGDDDPHPESVGLRTERLEERVDMTRTVVGDDNDADVGITLRTEEASGLRRGPRRYGLRRTSSGGGRIARGAHPQV